MHDFGDGSFLGGCSLISEHGEVSECFTIRGSFNLVEERGSESGAFCILLLIRLAEASSESLCISRSGMASQSLSSSVIPATSNHMNLVTMFTCSTYFLMLSYHKKQSSHVHMLAFYQEKKSIH
jgi:hypothetical protein